ncbi:MAG: inorganic diphosphatase [Deltaproteobacteria bacterium]|nr:inorganic diphosphatase [Deltaproteobacteria bacterium]
MRPTVFITVEVPRGALLKRDGAGRIDLVSPLPAPFNYGSVPGTLAEDGEPLDALLLGPPLPRGHRGAYPVWAVVRFTDDGLVDDKLVCGLAAPTTADRRRVERFFAIYAPLKRALHLLRGARGATRFGGWSEALPASMNRD